MIKDSYKHQGKRKQLIDYLQSKGIQDTGVLNAMNQVPRHLFLDSAFEDYAYQNKAFSIGSGQTISQPYTVAFQTQLLDVRAGDKILEIGTGSGYQTAVLVAMGAEVYTIERQKKLFDSATNLLQQLKFVPKYQSFGDGYKGLPTFAPFDKIIVTAGAPKVPKLLLEQLNIGGLMVIPLGKEQQMMTSFLRLNENDFEQMDFGEYQFVPMLESKDL